MLKLLLELLHLPPQLIHLDITKVTLCGSHVDVGYSTSTVRHGKNRVSDTNLMAVRREERTKPPKQRANNPKNRRNPPKLFEVRE
ncbi:hypothetical protein CRG98_022049 [Punica granatum]|uniref:Uncharacterized protein n=1 Tax=Punica granatum TaxID=22663 RepID=A0A2I0JMR4_PUNGR|nr:hypothetical protein CRG98_022049 [Punica granatum]